MRRAPRAWKWSAREVIRLSAWSPTGNGRAWFKVTRLHARLVREGLIHVLTTVDRIPKGKS